MTHQNVIINGVDQGAEVRKYSKFCNEGKWTNFIAPLLPQGEVFIEYGSNAGMFLKLARQRYSRVIGVERSRSDCDVAEQYRGDCDYQIIHKQIDDKLRLPLADVVLLANFHYHQHIDEFRRILNVLEERACHVLVVSVNQPQRHWRAQSDIVSVMSYFRRWGITGLIDNIDGHGDPHPRPMYSVIFESPKIYRMPLDKIVIRNDQSREWQYLDKFVDEALKRPHSDDFSDTLYYGIQRRRRQHKWSESRLTEFVQSKAKLIADCVKNGQYEPLLIDSHNCLIDGLHRFSALKKISKTAIVCRM